MGIKVTKVSVISVGLFAVALSIPGVYGPVRAIVRDGSESVWIDALNTEVEVKRTVGGFVFTTDEGV